ncbi:hypothetical protein PMG11_02845 [Penicillium brasilianum]|uniref:Uncharacterized protein n=1 Tax=Penicillium brasilianum TaxID=104259 RepID=A0A0F7TJ76_PENBI|nr:hypothetical protein PMG11_02845 [Penicillium brasilianum]
MLGMASEMEIMMQDLAKDVGKLKDHTNYTRWHSRLRRALKQRDSRFWPTLTGANKPPVLHKLYLPDDNVVREGLAEQHIVPLESISADQIVDHINKTVHEPNASLSAWQAIDQKLLPLFLVTLGSHLQFHVRLAKTGSDAYHIIEGMFHGPAKHYVWANWINCTFSTQKTATEFVHRWRRALDEVLYLFENDAPSLTCQLSQFMAAIDGHPGTMSWAREASFDMSDASLMEKVFRSFLSRLAKFERAANGLKVHWNI